MADTGNNAQNATTRRDVLRKGAVAAGVAGVAWSAPRVEGLSLRPNYAAAQSAPVCADFGLTANRTSVRPDFASYGGEGDLTHPTVGVDRFVAGAGSFSGGGVNGLSFSVKGDGLSNCSLNVNAVDPAVAFNVSQTTATSRRLVAVVFGSFGGPDTISVTGELCCD